jgi:hypothetical protein
MAEPLAGRAPNLGQADIALTAFQGNAPKAFSISPATARETSSRQGCATTWTPIGSPSPEVPARTTVLGQPVRLKACA